MKRCWLLLLVLAACPGLAGATEIEGKWGLGVEVGNLFSSSPETSLIRGRSARTAWVLDMSASARRDDRDLEQHDTLPDTTFTRSLTENYYSIDAGPRLRRFLRPESSFSPYWDVFAHAVGYSNRQSYSDGYSNRSTEIGGRAGVAFGAEYFLSKWPVSVAAHTEFATFSGRHTSTRASSGAAFSKTSGTVFSGNVGIRPIVQVRVYF